MLHAICKLFAILIKMENDIVSETRLGVKRATLELKSDYHFASYHQRDTDVWIFTNSTKVNLSYIYTRLGLVSILIDWKFL